MKLDTQENAPETGASIPAGPGSPPPWWAWVIVGVVVAGVAVYTGARQVPALFRRPRSPYRVLLHLDDHPEGLPLATEPGRERTLHVRIVPRDPREPGSDRGTKRSDRAQKRARVRIRSSSHGRLYTGEIGDEPLALTIPGSQDGDHELTVHAKRSPLGRPHRTWHLLRVAPWPEQVARDYQDLADAVRHRHPGAPAITPRQCRELLERLEATNDDAAKVVKDFEESNYSPKEVNERDWVAFAVRTRRLQQALHTGPGEPYSRRHGPPKRPVRGEHPQGSRLTG